MATGRVNIGGVYTGDATAINSDILASKTAYVNGSKVTGTLPRKVGRVNAISASKVTNDLVVVPEGGSYNHNDTTDIKVSQAQLIAAEPNINANYFLATKSVFGVIGAITDRSSAYTPATAADGITTAGRIYFRPQIGYYDGTSATQIYFDDANFASANIPINKTIFNKAGTYNSLVPQAGENAVYTGGSTTVSSGTASKVTSDVTVNYTGVLRISMVIHSSSSAWTYAQIYKNGVAFGTYRQTDSLTDVTFTEDLAFSAGDLISIYMSKVGGASYGTITSWMVKSAQKNIAN